MQPAYKAGPVFSGDFKGQLGVIATRPLVRGGFGRPTAQSSLLSQDADSQSDRLRSFRFASVHTFPNLLNFGVWDPVQPVRDFVAWFRRIPKNRDPDSFSFFIVHAESNGGALGLLDILRKPVSSVIRAGGNRRDCRLEMHPILTPCTTARKESPSLHDVD